VGKMKNKYENSIVTIDRCALAQRHNPVRTASNTTSPIQVGNGCFAFGADITVTDSDPNLRQWLISNPNRMNLGRIGLWFADSKVSEQDLSDCTQHLDLWTGTIHSVMKMQGANIIVDSASHPTQDAVGLTIESSLLSISELSIFLDFPFNDGRSKFSAPYTGIWDQDSDHTTAIVESDGNRALLLRQVDDAKYFVGVRWNQSGKLERQKGHRFVLRLSGSFMRLDVTVTFSQQRFRTFPSCRNEIGSFAGL
jgi:hypothetical protein